MRDTELRVKLDSAENACLVIDEVYANDYVIVFDLTTSPTYTYTLEDLRVMHDARKKIYSIIKGPANTLVVDVNIEAMDSGVLGSAGFTSTTTSGSVTLSTGGILNLNSSTWETQRASVRKDGKSLGYYTFLHEVLHIVGIGTLWRSLSLVDDTTGYVGANGLREYRTLFENDSFVAVPLEDGGSAGTKGGHMEEDSEQSFGALLHPALDREVMTGYAETAINDDEPMILSRITVGMLQDMGLAVNYDGADDALYPNWHKYNDVFGGYLIPDQTITASVGLTVVASTNNTTAYNQSSVTVLMGVHENADVLRLSSDGTLMVRYYVVTHTPSPGAAQETTTMYDEFIVTKDAPHDMSLGIYGTVQSVRLFFKKFSYDHDSTLFSKTSTACPCYRECLPFKILTRS